MGRSTKAGVVTAIVVAGFFVAVVFHYVKGIHLGMPYPHNTFLFKPADRFADFRALLDWNRGLNPYLRESATAQYPLLNLLSYALSTIDPDWSLIAYNGVVIGAMLWLNGVALYRADKALVYVNTAVITLLTYPFLFTIDRGNFESLLCVFLLLFSYCYQRKHYKVAALCLACTIAMKLFPVVLLVLFVSDRKYGVALQAVLWTTLLTLLSTAAFKGGVYANLTVLLSGRNLSSNANLVGFLGNNAVVQRSISLFSVLKILIVATGTMATTDMSRILHNYAWSMLVLFALVTLYVIFIECRLWRKVTLLVFAMLLFPQISADYKLMHVLIPLLLFINASTGSKLDGFFAVCFGLLLVSKDYVLLDWVHSEGYERDLSINMLINPFLMILMMSLIVATGFRGTNWATIRKTFIAHRRAIGRLLWPIARKSARTRVSEFQLPAGYSR